MIKKFALCIITVMALSITATAVTLTNSVNAVPPTVDSRYMGVGPGVYMLEAIVDLSTINSTNLATGDVIQCIPVRSNSVVLRTSLDVVEGAYTNDAPNTNWVSTAMTGALGDGSGAASYIAASSLQSKGVSWASTPAATASTVMTLQKSLLADTNGTIAVTNATAATTVTMSGYSNGKQYTASDTIDLTIGAAGACQHGARGKIKVRAWILDLAH